MSFRVYIGLLVVLYGFVPCQAAVVTPATITQPCGANIGCSAGTRKSSWSYVCTKDSVNKVVTNMWVAKRDEMCKTCGNSVLADERSAKTETALQTAQNRTKELEVENARLTQELFKGLQTKSPTTAPTTAPSAGDACGRAQNRTKELEVENARLTQELFKALQTKSPTTGDTTAPSAGDACDRELNAWNGDGNPMCSPLKRALDACCDKLPHWKRVFENGGGTDFLTFAGNNENDPLQMAPRSCLNSANAGMSMSGCCVEIDDECE